MDVEIIINGGVTLILIPKNEMEEKALEELAKQKNETNIIRNGTKVLNHTITKGMVIGKNDSNTIIPPSDEPKS